MSTLAAAGAHPPGPSRPPGAEVATRIPVPISLPVRYDGERLKHLSHSSYSLFLSCPEAWRRRYLKGEREKPSGAMFLGSRVDDALTHYYRRLLGHRERLGGRAGHRRLP